MTPAYYNQPPYPPAPWPPQPAPQQPPKPARVWPLNAVNRWMTIGLVGVTLLAVLLAFLAPVLTEKPSTAGLKLLYQNSLTKDDGNWDANANCVFSSSGYTATAPDAQHAAYCALHGQSIPASFTVRIRITENQDTAVIGFLSTDRLAILGSGRFLFYQKDDPSAAPRYVIPPTSAGAGSVALHPSAQGTSNRANEITIQVQGLTYSFYANGQLLATYNSPAQEAPGTITLIAVGGTQATYSDIAIYS